jgi:uncharacterized protein YlxP (DUF503 family)
MGAYVELLLVDLHFPQAESLKAKRSELQSVKAQLHGRHGLTVAEVAHHDVWQRATLAAALTGSSPAKIEAAADRVQRWLEARFPEGVRITRALASFEDLMDLRGRVG